MKKWLPRQRLNWYGSNQHTTVFPDKFYEKSSNFVSVAAIVAKIQIFEISADTTVYDHAKNIMISGWK